VTGQAKIRTFEAVSASLADLPDHVPAVLCGDLNAPWHEAHDGTITTFGQTPKGKVRGGTGAQEDDAERAILRPPGWCDAFRALHGYDVSGHSWKDVNGYRLDHILLSSHLVSVECEYDHVVRTERLSDHSAMFATFAPATPPPVSSS
jgi:exonuclease III